VSLQHIAKALEPRGHMRFIHPMPLTNSPLLELLARHLPSDAKEREDLERMRAFAVDLPSPFSRSQPTAHFTGSAVVVDPSGERVVLLHHGKLKRWLQPGGHAEEVDGGSMEASALREAREETGCQVRLHPTAPRPLDVDIHRIPARKDEPEHFHLDVRYLVVADNPEALVHDPNESFGAQWLGWAEALQRADEAPLRRLLEKARAAARAK
jgi:8-oxo-dGTP pyrophosphatase MutT (NUDIX family)